MKKPKQKIHGFIYKNPIYLFNMFKDSKIVFAQRLFDLRKKYNFNVIVMYEPMITLYNTTIERLFPIRYTRYKARKFYKSLILN